MPLKILGVLSVVLGFVMMVFAVMAYRELHGAASSHSPPTAASMPLARMVIPELFGPGAGAKPSELAQRAVNRIYCIGAGSVVLIVTGVLAVVVPLGGPATQKDP